MEVDVRLILLAILYAVIQAQNDSSRGKMFLLLLHALVELIMLHWYFLHELHMM